MGWSAEQTGKASLWQYQAALAGWRTAHCPEPEDGLTDSEFRRLSAALDAFEPAGAPN